MWINSKRHVLIFILWDIGEIKAYLLCTQTLAAKKNKKQVAPFFYCPYTALTAVCNSVPSHVFIGVSLEKKSSGPHRGLPVKTNRHGDQACQLPTVGGDWDIIGVSNERRQRIRVPGPSCSSSAPESRCVRITSVTPRRAWGTNEGSGR